MSAQDPLFAMLAEALGHRPERLTPLHGGCVARVYRADFADRPPLAIKHEFGPDAALDVEAFMLDELRAQSELPWPLVEHAAPTLLALEFIEHDGRKSAAGERTLATWLAAQHSRPTTEPTFGLERDTRIGPLVQPNATRATWAEFYCEQRLRPFGRQALQLRAITLHTMEQLDQLCDRMESLLAPTAADPPALIHGDLWAGNILWDHGQPRALIDPACHRAHPEVELAFIALMGGMSPAFWEAYEQMRPLPAGWDQRRLIYQLYPLLVHAILFGGGYGNAVQARLDRLFA